MSRTRVAVLAVLLLSPCTNLAAQCRLPGTDRPMSRQEIEMRRQMAEQRNRERFAKIKEDTEKLLKLATELKKSVGEANEATLSMDVIRKAERIEKLAKSVKNKMKGK